MSGAAADGLAELAESIFADARGRGGPAAGRGAGAAGFDAALWARLTGAGLARLTLPAAAGGSEGSFGDAAVLLAAAGRHAAAVPLVETDLQAGWLAHRAGLAVPDGPLTAIAAPLQVRRTGGDRAVRGRLTRVAWAGAAAAVVVLTGEHVLLLDPAVFTVATGGTNLAEEPRDTLAVDGVLPAGSVAPAPHGAARELRLRGALGRAQLLAGAASGALAAAVGHAGQREQFGRPIGRFQAVQQQLALAAAEVAAATAAAAGATMAATADGVVGAWLPIAAAKARTSEAAGVVARIAHQVHGAIGFTREHDLRLVTTRLWAWRDEDGSDAEWNTEIGELAFAAGADGLWPLVTGG